jgi:membrane associated rhomboid family serine protease
MARGADLFVVCKNCGSEVSPYVTECPYCGQRVRKRAPKIERPGTGAAEPPKAPRRRRTRRTRASSRLRSVGGGAGGGPGAAADGWPVATIALVAASFLAYLVAVAGGFSVLDAIVIGPLDGEWWRLVTASFVHLSGGSIVFALGAYQFATMVGIGVFGSALERRHGPLTVLAVALLAGAGGMLVAAAIEAVPLAAGANGMALGLLAAWAVPDLLAWRRDEDWEGDLLGAAVIAVVLLLMPAVVEVANAIVGVSGAVIGLLLGLPLARAARR